MLYILYILLGLLIVLGVDCAITAFLAIRDTLKYQKEDRMSFTAAFMKYFAKNNNIPTSFSDIFEQVIKVKTYQTILYPLICFFSLILSLAVFAKLVGDSNILFTLDVIAQVRFASLVLYAILIVFGGYLLIKMRSVAVCIVAGLIFLLSACYLMQGPAQFTLLIYYFLYSSVLAVLAIKQLKTK